MFKHQNNHLASLQILIQICLFPQLIGAKRHDWFEETRNYYPLQLSCYFAGDTIPSGGLIAYSWAYGIRFGPEYKRLNMTTSNSIERVRENPSWSTMLDTVHGRSFVIDARPDKCAADEQKSEADVPFCNKYGRKLRYDPNTSDAEQWEKGEMLDIVDEESGQLIGVSVTDVITLGQREQDAIGYVHRFGVMNARAATMADYWHIQMDKNGTTILWDNPTVGMLSLAAGIQNRTENERALFGEQSFVEVLIENYRMKPIISMAFFKLDHGHGLITFGALFGDSRCSPWTIMERQFLHDNGSAWSFLFDFFDNRQEAIIDIGTNRIEVPTGAWPNMDRWLNDEVLPHCVHSRDRYSAFRKMPNLSLKIGTLHYHVPAKFYMWIKETDNNTGRFISRCESRIVKSQRKLKKVVAMNADKNNGTFATTTFVDDHRWHLGEPFLLDRCVAWNFRQWQLWLSGGEQVTENAGMSFLQKLRLLFS